MNINFGSCSIRSWQFGDEDSLPFHANNWAIWLNLRDSFPYPYTSVDAQRWIQYVVDPVVETNFAIDVDGEAIGNIGLRIGEDIDRHTAELWYWIGQNYWGRGIASIALKTMADYAFSQLGLLRLYAKPMAHNTASIRVLEKSGFRLEGVLRESTLKEGKLLDSCLYAYLASDWLVSSNDLM